jgi:hypothetical protein
MDAISGTYINGEIVLDTPPDWPEGARVVIRPVDQVTEELPADDDVSPDAIAHRLSLMDQVQPWMTPEEEAEWKKQRDRHKAEQLAMWEKWTQDVGKLFK